METVLRNLVAERTRLNKKYCELANCSSERFDLYCVFDMSGTVSMWVTAPNMRLMVDMCTNRDMTIDNAVASVRMRIADLKSLIAGCHSSQRSRTPKC